jgi:hypothetical protein
MVLQPTQARACSSSQSLEASSRVPQLAVVTRIARWTRLQREVRDLFGSGQGLTFLETKFTIPPDFHDREAGDS